MLGIQFKKNSIKHVNSSLVHLAAIIEIVVKKRKVFIKLANVLGDLNVTCNIAI